MLADGPTPLDAVPRPFPGDAQRVLGAAHTGRRQGEAAGVQRRQGNLEPLAFPPEAVRGRDPDLLEAGHPVLDAAQTHELVAVLHLHAGCVGIDDETRDATAMTGRARDDRHDHQPIGDHTVGGPQLAAAQLVGGAALDRHRLAAHPGRVAAHVGLGQQERADLLAGHLR